MKRLLPRSFLLVSVCAVAALGLACDSAIPTAPAGTILTLSANPSQINLNGSSTITVVGRKPNGSPLNEGTEILFSTDRGTIGPTIVAVDEGGVARATLRGDGRAGTANVEARVSTTAGGGEGGGGTGAATVAVQIGVDPEARPTLLVSASPSTLFVGESSEITVIARSSDGSPVGGGETIILTTTLGTLNPSRPRTKADGTATSILEVGTQPGSAEVTAILGASDPVMTTVTIQDTVTTLNVIPRPSSIQSTGGTIEIDAFAFNSQELPVPGRQVAFGSERGSFDESNIDFTDTQGRATVTLVVTEQQLGTLISFTVSASIGTVQGTAEIKVEGRE
jgi:hypothetical protein